MRWRTGRRSSNIEDRRGQRTSRRARLGGGMKLGGGTMIIIVVVALLLGADPGQILNMLAGGGGTMAPQSTQVGHTQSSGKLSKEDNEQADFVSVVLADTEDTWAKIFAAAGERYQPPTLVLFTDMTQTACGFGKAATGPFYCPPDQQIYIDLSFFRELQRLGAPGDFARAYVIAHEVAHHVQNITGIGPEVRRMQQGASRADANALSVLTELQADCYAGLWAHHAQRERQILETGDIEEGLQAAASIGDDRLQRSAGRAVNPDSFTHGSSEQRVHWFRTGLEKGSLKACDTFAKAGV